MKSLEGVHVQALLEGEVESLARAIVLPCQVRLVSSHVEHASKLSHVGGIRNALGVGDDNLVDDLGAVEVIVDEFVQSLTLVLEFVVLVLVARNFRSCALIVLEKSSRGLAVRVRVYD